MATKEAVSWARGDAVKSTAAISIGNKTIPAIPLAPVALTKDNIKQTIIKDGFQNLGTIAKGLPKEKRPLWIRIGAAGGRLFQTPERSIRLYQFEACIPRFMAAPDNLGLRFAARPWMDQTDALVQRKIRSHHRHAPGLTHVHGDGVSAFSSSALFPLYEELNPRDDALVASQTFPSFLCGPV